METIIMAITIEPRSKSAPYVQEILTMYGCNIKTRLGMHESSNDNCSERGLILLHVCSSKEDAEKLKKDLLNIPGVKVNYMTI